MAEKLIPIEHPGIFLKEEFMVPLEVSVSAIQGQ
jgi:plasmid maintenance system antidote protein VapI